MPSLPILSGVGAAGHSAHYYLFFLEESTFKKRCHDALLMIRKKRQTQFKPTKMIG
jgi:hypothetical protein